MPTSTDRHVRINEAQTAERRRVHRVRELRPQFVAAALTGLASQIPGRDGLSEKEVRVLALRLGHRLANEVADLEYKEYKELWPSPLRTSDPDAFSQLKAEVLPTPESLPRGSSKSKS